MLTDNRLRIFVALAETGSFTAAAKRLGVSQPAVSQCIVQLEEEAGEPLVVRGRGEVTLTPTGERMLQYSHRILDLYDSLSAELGGAAPAPRTAEFPMPDGRTAVVSAEDGSICITFRE